MNAVALCGAHSVVVAHFISISISTSQHRVLNLIQASQSVNLYRTIVTKFSDDVSSTALACSVLTSCKPDRLCLTPHWAQFVRVDSVSEMSHHAAVELLCMSRLQWAQYSKGWDLVPGCWWCLCRLRVQWPPQMQRLHAQYVVAELICKAVTCSINAVQMLHIMQVGRAAAHGVVLNNGFDGSPRRTLL